MSARDELARTIRWNCRAISDTVARTAASAIIAAGYRKPRRITTPAELDGVLDGTTVRGVTKGRSFYTIQFNDDGFWNQMGCDDEWDNQSLFPFFDYLEVIWEPTA